ncbi:hypothetical protein AKJ16_DCAP15503 [Drosera capensis]
MSESEETTTMNLRARVSYENSIDTSDELFLHPSDHPNSSAAEIWEELAQRFGQPNGAKPCIRMLVRNGTFKAIELMPHLSKGVPVRMKRVLLGEAAAGLYVHRHDIDIAHAHTAFHIFGDPLFILLKGINPLSPSSTDLDFLSLPPHTSSCPDISPSLSPQNSLKHSTRDIKHPFYLKDYVLSKKPRAPSTDPSAHFYYLVHFDSLAASAKAHIEQLSDYEEPLSYKAASTDPRWITAMQHELNALEANGTCSLVDLLAGIKPIGSK